MASEVRPPTTTPRSSPLENFVNNTLRNPLQVIGLLIVLFLLVVAIANISSVISTETARGNNGIQVLIERLLQQLYFGLSTGSIYALIALGYTLVYGILLMINFAHGEVFMAGAYVGFFVITAMDYNGMLENQTVIALLITIVVAMFGSVIIAVLLERIAYRPLRKAPRLVPLITAIGASILLQELFQRLFGASARRYPDISLPFLPGTLGCETVDGTQTCAGLDLFGTYKFLGINVRPIAFIVFILALLLMAALWTFIKRTKTGKAMRAVAEDKNTAALMGINVDSVIVTTFILGAALAGAGAVLFSIIPGNGQITPQMGFFPGIKAFTAAVLGGIGNVPGAMFGGLFLGVAEAVGPTLLGLPAQLKDVVAFGLLVLILIFRPSGIFGEVLAQKKA